MINLYDLGGMKVFFDGKELKETLPPAKLLAFFLGIDQLKKTFNSKFISSTAKGLDRLKGSQFAVHLDEHLQIVSRKCLSGKYIFTPFAQVLQLKGRNKPPRLIGIPTVRDRLVLHQLKDVLAFTFPECVPKARANTLIHRISREIKELDLLGKANTSKVYGCDIQKFYDEINRDLLFEALAKRIKSSKVLRLLKSAVTTPTVPRNYRRGDLEQYSHGKGVPQGLAISNILAAIYLADFDTEMSSQPIKYYRYVDDILVFGGQPHVEEAMKLIESRLDDLGLKTHPIGEDGKSHFSSLSDKFGYLGYLFLVPKISVRPATVERFLQSIVGKFTDYRYNKEWRKSQFKYLTNERLKDIFIAELNERITGAISGKRRYGWIAYFSETTDIELLKRLDTVIARFFKRLADFDRKPPESLKSLVRAYYEMRYSPIRGYIQNYDKIVTLIEKMKFLEFRGKLDPAIAYSENEINEYFESYRNKRLSELEPDDGMLY